MISLPIDQLIPQILESVDQHQRILLTATPGAGKTTRVPAELLKVVKGKIAVLEPRRLATIGAAQRIADEQQWKLGSEVGYQVRFESRLTSTTRLVFMTDAVLLRRLVDDPELKDFDLIVIDEFHERNLNQDLVLGIIKELQELGRDIKLLIMSATLDVSHLQRFLPDAYHFDVPGLVYPLETRNVTQASRLSTDHDFIQRVVNTTLSVARENRGDMIVFLPGVGEINRVQTQLEASQLNRDILPLHGSLPLNEQRQLLAPGQRPRIVLATNIAEASVTVPGTDTVIDSGLARIVTVNLKSGFERLELTRIAKFNTRQRSGRAARQKAGLCVRLWTTFEEASLDEQMTPECQRVDLSSTLLLLSHLGVRDFKQFAWLDQPPEALFNFAFQFLQTAGAFDDQLKLTDLGQKLMSYPLPPRWGHLFALSEKYGDKELGAKASALLNDRDILQKGFEISTHTECDVTFRLQLLDEVAGGRRPNGVNIKTAQTVLEAAEQLESTNSNIKSKPSDENSLRRLLLLSQTDRLSRRRREGHALSHRAVMVGGRGVRLSKESQVKESEFFLSLQAMELPGQPDTAVTIACGLEKAFVLETLKDRIQIAEDIFFDEAKGRFFSRRIRRYKDLDLDEPTLTPINPAELGERFVEALVARWPWLIEKNEKLKAWMQRWSFICKLQPDFAAHLNPSLIKESLERAAYNKSEMQAVLNEDLANWLESVMDNKIVQEFHREVPAQFIAATGNRYPIHYSETESPYVEVRLQEMFGVTVNPRLGFGKIPLTFKLLAPNYRPTQVTSDIASFWKTVYFEVRKELRTRYPKHSWPEDPLTAPPVAKGPRRRN
jgi:ATP-dependent helicase HrpB